MEDVNIFYDLWFNVIWYILCTFGIFCSTLVYTYSPVLVCYTKKNLATMGEPI
jgi:hypothetical protein